MISRRTGGQPPHPSGRRSPWAWRTRPVLVDDHQRPEHHGDVRVQSVGCLCTRGPPHTPRTAVQGKPVDGNGPAHRPSRRTGPAHRPGVPAGTVGPVHGLERKFAHTTRNGMGRDCGTECFGPANHPEHQGCPVKPRRAPSPPLRQRKPVAPTAPSARPRPTARRCARARAGSRACGAPRARRAPPCPAHAAPVRTRWRHASHVQRCGHSRTRSARR